MNSFQTVIFAGFLSGCPEQLKRILADLVIELFQPQESEVRIDDLTLLQGDMRSMRQINDYAREALLLFEIVWKRILFWETNNCRRVLMTFLTEGYEGFNVDDSYDHTLSRNLVYL